MNQLAIRNGNNFIHMSANDAKFFPGQIIMQLYPIAVVKPIMGMMDKNLVVRAVYFLQMFVEGLLFEKGFLCIGGVHVVAR